MYIEKNYRDVLDKANLFGEDLCPAKNDYESGSIFYGLFLGTKKEHCLTNNEFGFIKEQKTSNGFNDSKRLLDRSQFFKMLGDKKYQLCCLKVGKYHLVKGLSYQRK